MIEKLLNRNLLLLWCWVPAVFDAVAQPAIPPGTWRLHLSYSDIRFIEVTPEKIFAAGISGIIVYDLQDKSLKTYNKLNALSATGITALAYDARRRQLLVGYENGLLDIIGESEASRFSRLRDAGVTTSKGINHISVREDLAYLSTAYGVVIFDLRQREIKETWRDLGPSGEPLAVHASTFLNDSIFIASANGVLVGNHNDNLLDFNNWRRFNAGAFAPPILAITTFNDKVYAAGPAGVYRFTGDDFVQEPYLQTEQIISLSSSNNHLLMIADSTVWILDKMGNLSRISDATIKAPAAVKQSTTGDLWIGDRSAGLLSNAGGTFISYLPDGPSENTVFRMTHQAGKIFAISGGFSAAGQPLNRPGDLNIFDNGAWRTSLLPAADLTDVAVRDNKTFVATFGAGIVVTDASGNVSVYDETNSPILSVSTGDARVAALAGSADGLWVANYGGAQPLHLLKSDGSWQSFGFAHPDANKPTELAVDAEGNVWMALNPELGGGLIAFDARTGKEYDKTTAIGAGALPHDEVGCMAVDRDGAIWVGTQSGVAYFPSVAEDAIKPIYEGRFLLRNERITALAVDGGNRKWIGTEAGAWLFSPTGEALVHHFTAENSPLLSNSVGDIAIDPQTGEVFFATDRGVVSYRSDATEAGPQFGNVRIFPNPVRPGFTGTVGIDGLASDALVRITDVTGKLVWQTQAHGGMASWNVRDQHGVRVSTGVYLVFAITADGSESVVGKVAVVSH